MKMLKGKLDIEISKQKMKKPQSKLAIYIKSSLLWLNVFLFFNSQNKRSKNKLKECKFLAQLIYQYALNVLSNTLDDVLIIGHLIYLFINYRT